MSDSESRPLSARERRFVDAYCAGGFIGSRAAKEAGFPERSAAQRAHELLKDPRIRAAIDERISTHALTANEVLSRLGDQARGIGEYIHVDVLDRMNLLVPDWERLRSEGKMHLVKGWEYTKDGQLIVHWVDPQAALMALGRHHKLFTDKHQVDVEIRDSGIAESLDRKLADLAARIAQSGDTESPDGPGESGA